MALITQTTQQFITAFIAAYAAQMDVDPNLPDGDPVKALAEADAAQAEVIQNMDEETVAFARAQTCTGADLDSWMAQFAFPRLPALAASGIVTFSAPSTVAQQIYIPVGTLVQTPGGAIQYQVIADNSLPGYNADNNAYIIPIGQQTVNVAMQALISGASFNVQAGQLNQLVNTIFGINTVSNAAAIINGANAETDNAYRSRFVDYINSLSKATKTAIAFAVESLQSNIKLALIENQQAIGNPPTSLVSPFYGNVIVLVDDGSGNPPLSLIQAATAAIEATIAWGVQFQCLPPAVLNPTIRMNIRVGPNGQTAVVEQNVQNAIIAYVNALPIGGTVWLSDIIQVALNADPNCLAIQDGSATINGVQASLVLSLFQEAAVSASNVVIGDF